MHSQIQAYQGPGKHIRTNSDLAPQPLQTDWEAFQPSDNAHAETLLHVGGAALGEFYPNTGQLTDVGGYDRDHALLDDMDTYGYGRRLEVIRRLREMHTQTAQPAEAAPSDALLDGQQQTTLGARLKAMGGLQGHTGEATRGLGKRIQGKHPIDESPEAIAKRRAAREENLRHRGIIPDNYYDTSDDNEPTDPMGATGIYGRRLEVIRRLREMREPRIVPET